MPARHSPPPAGTLEAAETLKGSKRKGSKQKRVDGLRYLTEAEPGTLTLSTDPPLPPGPAENHTSPATSLTDTTDNTGNTGTVPVHFLSQDATNKLDNPDKTDGEEASQGAAVAVRGVEFHHESEAEFARLLNYYGIEWQYEPHQFPLRWHEGRPVEMFSPDFYLSEYDLHIELTTMRQSLVRRKNRKLRLLRALYPEINIKLLYRRDYQRLLERFGIAPQEMEAESRRQ